MFDATIWSYWLDVINVLLPRLFVTIIAALILLRFNWFRYSMRKAENGWQHRIILIVVFGTFAASGTYYGVLVNIHSELSSMEIQQKPIHLKYLDATQAVVGFRDTWSLIAGLTGGPWVGMGTGLLAGVFRYSYGGFAGLPSSIGSLTLGLFAGLVKLYRPKWTQNALSVLGVALIGTLLQRLILLRTVQPISDALLLTGVIGVPVAIINISGCVLFFWIMLDLERDRLENEAREVRLMALQTQVERDRQEQLAQQAELRAFRAQFDPHFMNNALNDLHALIRIDPHKARSFVTELAGFCHYTRECAGPNTISLQDELERLRRFLAIHRLRLEDKLQDSIDIPEHLLSIEVLPGCLLTLVENALKHAFTGCQPPYQLNISAETSKTDIVLSVRDNGRGIYFDRLRELGKTPVQSVNQGGGVALYQLAQCLALEFGASAKLKLENNAAGKGIVVYIIHTKRSAEC